MEHTRQTHSKRLLAPLLIALVALPLLYACSSSDGASYTGGASYYVDSISGDDANSGTAESTPWQSLTKVSASTFSPGSTIYLKRGDTWNEQLTIPSSRITISAYGSGAAPLIDGSHAISGWSSLGGGLYSAPVTLTSGEALGNLSENGTLMTFLPWQSNVTTTFSGAADGSYSYNNTSSTLYIKTSQLPSSTLYRASVKPYGIIASNKYDITVSNLDITRVSLHGIDFVNCTSCTVYNTAISASGGATLSPGVYAGNGIEFANSSTNGLVDGVTVSDIFDSCISPQTYTSSALMSGIVIRNSTLSRCGLAGIEASVLSNGGSSGSSIDNLSISGVTISDSGKGWSGQRYGSTGNGIQIRADAGAGSMNGVHIDTTSVSNAVGDGIVLSGEVGNVAMNRMLLTANRYGIILQETTATTTGFSLSASLVHHNSQAGILYDSPSAAGFTLYQDTIADNGNINLSVNNLNSTIDVRNNIFSSIAGIPDLYFANYLFGSIIDYNCYTNHLNMIGYAGSTYSTVTDFFSATAYEANGISGIQGLTDPATGDYTLTASSVCQSGTTGLGVGVDYSGYPYATPPSQGAYQYH